MNRTNLALGLGLAVLAALYVDGARRHARQVNTSLENTDQGTYLEYAANMRLTGYRYVGGRNQMPVYPFLQSLVFDPRVTADRAFERGKWFNILLSVGLLAVLFVVWRRFFPLLQSLALLLVTAFTLFLFKAAYIQTELLYYVVGFVGFLVMLRLVEAPSLRLALVAGPYLGLAHLTKASVLPGLGWFVFVGVLRAGWLAARAGRRRDPASWRGAGRQLAACVLVVGSFLVTISPYLINSKRVYGRAFYNVNSTFYMWYDTWNEAMRGTVSHGDRIGWPDLPPEEIPSLGKYVRTHTVSQMVARVERGLSVLFGGAVHTYGYWKYVVFYGLAALVVLLLRARPALGWARAHAFAVLFALGYLAGYTVLYAWYVPIAAGNRLILSLYLPFMFLAGLVLARRELVEGAGAGRAGWSPSRLVHALMLGALLLELPEILAHRIVTMYGGN